MDRAVHKLALAIGFGIGAIVAVAGALSGLNVGELALACGISIAALYLLVRLIGGYYASVIARRLAENRAEQATRHLLDPKPTCRSEPPA